MLTAELKEEFEAEMNAMNREEQLFAHKMLHKGEVDQAKVDEQNQREEAIKAVKNKGSGLDEIEEALMQKERARIIRQRDMSKKQIEEERLQNPLLNEVKESQFKAKYVKNRALIDQQLINNERAHFSYAERKWNWQGEEGFFNKDDLMEWFRLYNQTHIQDVEQIKEAAN